MNTILANAARLARRPSRLPRLGHQQHDDGASIVTDDGRRAAVSFVDLGDGRFRLELVATPLRDWDQEPEIDPFEHLHEIGEVRVTRTGEVVFEVAHALSVELPR